MRVSGRRLAVLSAYWVAINYLWQGMGALILPREIVGMVPASHRGVALAGLSIAGAVVAVLVQPVAGALSDRTRLSWGRRKPFILAGTLADLLCLLGLALAGSYGALLLPYCALQVSSNTAEGAYQGLLPDQVPPGDRGRAAGYYGIAVFLGTALGFLLTGQLIAVGHLGLALGAAAGTLVICLLLTLALVPDTPAGPERPSAREAVLGIFGFDFRHHPDFAWLLGSRLLALMGITGLTDFALLFIKASFYPGGGSALADRASGATSVLLAVVVVSATVVTLPAGHLSQRWGRVRMVRAAAFLGAAGTILLIPSPSILWVYVVGVAVGAAFGMLLSVDWALVTDLVPPAQAGRFMGISNLATAGAGILATAIGGPILDLGNAVRPRGGFVLLFLFLGTSLVAGGWLVGRVRVPVPR